MNAIWLRLWVLLHVMSFSSYVRHSSAWLCSLSIQWNKGSICQWVCVCIFLALPTHAVPLMEAVYPGLQWHLYEPMVLMHFPFLHTSGMSLHSSMSTQKEKNIIPMNHTVYARTFFVHLTQCPWVRNSFQKSLVRSDWAVARLWATGRMRPTKRKLWGKSSTGKYVQQTHRKTTSFLCPTMSYRKDKVSTKWSISWQTYINKSLD